MEASDDLRRLEYLSLVSKVCTELENHLGISDKDLGDGGVVVVVVSAVRVPVSWGGFKVWSMVSSTAEFIICLAEQHTSFRDFKAALVRNGAEFTVSTSPTPLGVTWWRLQKVFVVSGHPHRQPAEADWDHETFPIHQHRYRPPPSGETPPPILSVSTLTPLSTCQQIRRRMS